MIKLSSIVRLIFPASMVIIMFASCSKYQRLLKSTDYNLKYEKAVEYFKNEDYYRSLTLLEELINIFKGSEKAEEVMYYYAYCNYYQRDYILAGYHFKNFSKMYPFSKHREESDYMTAYCYYLNSPDASLDQTYTNKAINELQLFLNRFPESSRKEECNKLVQELREKLEYKSFANAKLYYYLGDYKAATLALGYSLKDYPDSKYREELLFLILKSSFLLAQKSVESKKIDRYQKTINEYYALVDEYPESKYLKEAKDIFEESMQVIKK